MRVPIGTKYLDALFILCIVLAVLGPAAAGVCMAVEPSVEFAVAAGGVGLFAVLGAIARGVVIARGRRWLEDTTDGFVLTDRRGEFAFTDAQVTDLATTVTGRFSNGVPKGHTRKGALVIEAEEFSGRLPYGYDYPLSRPDPLGDLFARLIDRLASAAERDIAAGGELPGDEWSLGKNGLAYRVMGEVVDEVLPPDDVAAAAVVERKVCVWAKGEELPCVKVPVAGANAGVLLEVLTRRLAARPKADDDEAAVGDGLGRVIFERNNSITLPALVGVTVVGVILFACGVAVLVFNLIEPPKSNGPWFLSAALTVIPAGIAVACWFNRQNVLRCHALGVCRLLNGKEQRMRYADVRGYDYSATRHYHKGAYTGTHVTMTFTGVDGDVIKYAAQFQNADDELDNLREHVSKVIAAAMHRRLNDGKPVRWTDRVTFTDDGLEIDGKAGLFGRGDDLFVPYADVRDFGLENGNFSLYVEGRKKSVFDTPVGEPNFFPGFMLLMRVCFGGDQERGADGRGDEQRSGV